MEDLAGLWNTLRKSNQTSSLMKKHCTEDVYKKLKDKQTTLGGTLAHCIRCGVTNLDSHVGVHASDPEAYTVFHDLLKPIILDYHKVSELKHPPYDFGNPDDLGLDDLDLDSDLIISTRVRVGRNHTGFGFPPTLNHEERLKMEKLTLSALDKLDGELKGKYHPLSELSESEQRQLIDDHYLFNNNNRFIKAAGGYADWPWGRGIYINEDNTFIVWMNEGDHLRIISMQKGDDLATVYRRLVRGVTELEKRLSFVRHPDLGFVTFCPSNLGTALRASVHIQIPIISQRPDFKEICTRLKLQARGVNGEHTDSVGGVYDISNKHRLGLSEIEAIQEMRKGVKELIKLETAASGGSNGHIHSIKKHSKGNINNITSNRTPQSSEDHSYIKTKNDVQLVEVSCQTELSMVDIKQMEDQVGCLREAGLTVDEIEKIKCENLELSDRLENKDYLMREIFIDKVKKTDTTTVQNFTGFPKKSYLDGVFDIFEKRDSQLNYWSGQKSNKQQAYQTDHNRKKSGPQRKLTRYQEFVMTWIRLRLGLTVYVLAHLFGISQSRVSQIFITWTTFMRDVLGPLLVWPTREQVYKHMPPSFRRQYPRTRVIIDCTEFFFQKPRSPHAQSATYSTYKSKNTAKLLVAITPSGTICFLSELYGGNASDSYITEHSGFLDRLEYGDDVMADRGFTIRDLVTMKHATLNIPPFTRKCNWGKGRFLSLSDIKKTRLIAKVRIHVERAIQRMKTFRLINQVIPWSLKPVMNQMVTIIAVVCNLHPKLVKLCTF